MCRLDKEVIASCVSQACVCNCTVHCSAAKSLHQCCLWQVSAETAEVSAIVFVLIRACAADSMHHHSAAGFVCLNV